MRESKEWEITKFCPNCRLSMMFFEVEYEHGWASGRCCPKCQFIYEPYGGSYSEGGDGKLLEIRIFHDVNRD